MIVAINGFLNNNETSKIIINIIALITIILLAIIAVTYRKKYNKKK